MENIIRKRFLISLASISLFFFSCTVNNNQDTIQEITQILDTLQLKYAPDSRIALWKHSFEIKNNSIHLSVYLENEAAHKEISRIMQDHFPEVNTMIDVLPEKEPERIIHGLINNSVANLRSHPGHSKELTNQALLGTPVRIYTKKYGWYLIQTPNNYIAWTDGANVAELDPDQQKKHQGLKKVVFKNPYGFSYTQPDEESLVVSDLVAGNILAVLREEGNYYKVQYPDFREAYVKKIETIDAGTLFSKEPEQEKLVQTAKLFHGVPYLWGGTSSKGLDCSGFTSIIYFLNGVVLQRDASQQALYGQPISATFQHSGLFPGDLLFFGRKATDSLPERVTHVGMYIGEGNFIHASGRVRMNSMDSTKEDFSTLYAPRFIRSVRMLNAPKSEGIQKVEENDFYKEILIF